MECSNCSDRSDYMLVGFAIGSEARLIGRMLLLYFMILSIVI